MNVTLYRFLIRFRRCEPGLKGYSSDQSHFSEINVKLAEKNELAAQCVQKCLETRENEQNVVLNESSEALGNHSEIVRILVLTITTADDDASGSNFVSEVVVRFSLFYKQNGAFWLAKSKTINFSSKDYFDRSICSFQRLAGQKKTVQVRSSSKFKLSLQRAGTRFNSKRSLRANIAE